MQTTLSSFFLLMTLGLTSCGTSSEQQLQAILESKDTWVSFQTETIEICKSECAEHNSLFNEFIEESKSCGCRPSDEDIKRIWGVK